MRLPAAGILRPATPPPDFDLDLAIGSLRRFAARRPTGVALAHFGLVPDPMATLAEAEETLTRWAEVAEAAWKAGEDIADALDAAFSIDPGVVDPEAREVLETLNGIHSNAAGFRRWLDKGGHGGVRASRGLRPPGMPPAHGGEQVHRHPHPH